MKERLLEMLRCPECGGEFGLEAGRREGAELIEGALTCRGCTRVFPILRGVPRLLPRTLSDEKLRTAAAFGWEWRHFRELHEEYKEQFLDWIHPLQPEFFGGKVVLDAGCGTGRHAYFASEFGAQDVVGMDLSDAVDTAFEHIGARHNVHIVQGDIYNPPFRKPLFDFAYSIGVLHHLPDPRAGFESILRFVKPGGTIFGWVYGHENNGIVHHGITPVRKAVTSHLPHALLSALSWPLTAVLEGVIHGVYVPLRGTSVHGRLPSAAYITSLGRFSFRQNHSIVFDHLVAPTAYYIKRDEFERWFTDNGLAEIELSWRNENSWRGRGQVPAAT